MQASAGASFGARARPAGGVVVSGRSLNAVGGTAVERGSRSNSGNEIEDEARNALRARASVRDRVRPVRGLLPDRRGRCAAADVRPGQHDPAGVPRRLYGALFRHTAGRGSRVGVPEAERVARVARLPAGARRGKRRVIDSCRAARGSGAGDRRDTAIRREHLAAYRRCRWRERRGLPAAGRVLAGARDAQHAHRRRHHAHRRQGAGPRHDRGRVRQRDRSRHAPRDAHRSEARLDPVSDDRYESGSAIRGRHQGGARQARREAGPARHRPAEPQAADRRAPRRSAQERSTRHLLQRPPRQSGGVQWRAGIGAGRGHVAVSGGQHQLGCVLQPGRPHLVCAE